MKSSVVNILLFAVILAARCSEYNAVDGARSKSNGDISADCEVFLDDIVQMLKNDTKKSKSNGDICADCEVFLDDMLQMLKNDTKKDIIVAVIVKLCKASESAICAYTVSEYGVLVVSYLSEFVVPKDICVSWNACSNQAFEANHQLKKSSANGDICADCMAFLTDLSVLLNNRTVKKRIITELYQICEILGCADIVDNYGMLVLNYIATHFVPKKLCYQMNFCPKSIQFSVERKLQNEKIPGVW